jgi:hypothetical protein
LVHGRLLIYELDRDLIEEPQIHRDLRTATATATAATL